MLKLMLMLKLVVMLVLVVKETKQDGRDQWAVGDRGRRCYMDVRLNVLMPCCCATTMEML